MPQPFIRISGLRLKSYLRLEGAQVRQVETLIVDLRERRSKKMLEGRKRRLTCSHKRSHNYPILAIGR
jgi:hypothetical protein